MSLIGDWLVDKETSYGDEDRMEFYCHLCHTTGMKKVGQAKRSLGEKGFAFQCNPCLMAKIATARSIKYSSDFLMAAGLVNVAPRVILHSSVTDFKCKCGTLGSKRWDDGARTCHTRWAV